MKETHFYTLTKDKGRRVYLGSIRNKTEEEAWEEFKTIPEHKNKHVWSNYLFVKNYPDSKQKIVWIGEKK